MSEKEYLVKPEDIPVKQIALHPKIGAPSAFLGAMPINNFPPGMLQTLLATDNRLFVTKANSEGVHYLVGGLVLWNLLKAEPEGCIAPCVVIQEVIDPDDLCDMFQFFAFEELESLCGFLEIPFPPSISESDQACIGEIMEFLEMDCKPTVH